MATVEIITIGDELVEGRLVDSNSALLSDRLWATGITVHSHRSLPDEHTAIVEALRDAASRADAVLVSGGLGPTTDDLTAACAAAAFERPLVRFPEALEHVERFFAERGRAMSPNNRKQADLPRGSRILPNQWGTAVGFALDVDGCPLYFMPGVPRELEGIFDESVLPELRSTMTGRHPLVATLKVFGKGESDVGQALAGLGDDLPPGHRLTIQYRATFPENHVRLVLQAGEAHLEHILEALVDEARERLGEVVFATGGARVDTSFADTVIDELAAHGGTVAVVEGFTAGLTSSMLRCARGSSAVFLGGVVIQGTPPVVDLLDLEGAVSNSGQALAESMAAAVRKRFRARLGLAVLGDEDLAPGDAPPGTVWVASASAERTVGKHYRFSFDLDRMRLLGAYVAANHAKRLVKGG